MDYEKLKLLEKKNPDLVDDLKCALRISSRAHRMLESAEILTRELHRLSNINKGDGVRWQLFEKAHAPMERAWREAAAAKEEITRLTRFYQKLANCEAKKI